MMLPRLYPILDTAVAERRGLDPVHIAGEWLAGGAGILQFRHKDFFSREVFNQMERIAAMCRDARVPFVVNDRADLAALLGAALHLGQEDLTPSMARRVIGPDAMIGWSTHNEAQLRAALAEPANYLALGPIFGTASKEDPDPIVGLDELRRLRPLADRPLVAIGGITRANALDVLAAGADSVAVIGDLIPEDGDGGGRFEEWQRLLAR